MLNKRGTEKNFYSSRTVGLSQTKIISKVNRSICTYMYHYEPLMSVLPARLNNAGRQDRCLGGDRESNDEGVYAYPP